MAFKLHAGAGVGEQARRGVASLLVETRRLLTPEGTLDASHVHDARTHIKRVRALLGLLQGASDDTAFRALQRALRAAGRAIGPLREPVARLAAYDELSAHCAREFSAEWRHSASREAHDTRLLPSATHALGQADALLATAQAQLATWAQPPHELAALVRGFQRSYAAALHAYRAAERKPTAEALHKLRRRTKRYQYQLQFLEPAQTRRMRARREHAEALSEILGRHHDLVLLGSALDSESTDWDEEALRALRKALAKRERRLRRAALSLARRVYDDPPRKGARLLRRRVRAWQPEVTR